MVYNIAFSLTMTPSTQMSDITKMQNFCILLHCSLRLCIPCEHHVSVSYCISAIQEFLSSSERCFNYHLTEFPNFWSSLLMRVIWQFGRKISIWVWQYFITCILVLQLDNSLQKHGVRTHRMYDLKPTQILQYFITRLCLFLLGGQDTQSGCKTTEEHIHVFFIVKKCKIFVSSY